MRQAALRVQQLCYHLRGCHTGRMEATGSGHAQDKGAALSDMTCPSTGVGKPEIV